MFCPKCGAQNTPAAKFCQKCGSALAAGPPPPPPVVVAGPPPPPPPPLPINHGTMRGIQRPVNTPTTGKSPVAAVVLSILIPGLGQFYNGDNKKGAIMLGLALVLGVLTLGVIWLGVLIWSAIDAYQVASGNGAMW